MTLPVSFTTVLTIQNMKFFKITISIDINQYMIIINRSRYS